MFKDDRYKGLSLADIKRDIIAGLTVGIVAIPLGMAFAIASGVKPEYGIYTTIFAGLLVALFGGSRFQIAGPTGAFIPILLAIVLEYGYEKLLVAGFLAGIMLLLMGIFKFGKLIQFIPRSVTIGFTSGIAVIIFSGQIGNFLGLEELEKKQYFHENMIQIAEHITAVNWYSVFTAIIGLFAIIYIPKLFPKVPVLLVALIFPTAVAMVFYPAEVATIGTSFGGIPQSLPRFQLPNITWETILELWQPAFVIAMLGGIESLLSAVVSDGMTGTKHNSNRELVGQGIANMVTPMFGGIPATGAIARTATNIKSGAVSPYSGIFQSVFVLIILLLFAPFASNIPLASMAPILMVVAYNMSEYKSFTHILKLKSGDSLVLVVTFLLTVFVNLTTAVQIGLLLAMVSFIKRMSEVLQVEKVIPDKMKETTMNDHLDTWSSTCPKLSFYTVGGALFFGAADKFESIITRSINQRPTVLILKMKHVSILDATGAANLDALVTDFKNMGGTIIISEANSDVLAMMKASGLLHKIGQHHIFSHSEEAVNHGLQLIEVNKCSICSKENRTTCKAFKQSTDIPVSSAEQ
ncbi:SulP family inorganic anion transporter [Virgibacillus pantothenticus]|uniref:SulP family inorganic anion transporter n=1 Tax=Virgibacillus pantothenticus TaxID=1473 RepID=UPI00067B34FB|nr:SulP family inorganic anion transporter [Virgibacillus pantothenticus]MED3738004.1 SulP family inorganic anion transporter [Virgibacillus pantothenticus]QTY17918.1 STAS domain-containing protein [Virgibacillus pantothenticus]SIS54249.1 sulfate permease, SulP family [Virgibacillus pantothenticus]